MLYYPDRESEGEKRGRGEERKGKGGEKKERGGKTAMWAGAILRMTPSSPPLDSHEVP